MQILRKRYEIIQQLGGGGFAITYLAKDLDRPGQPQCVVKQLRPNQTSRKVLEFFEREAEILEKLGEHPQIPRLLAHFNENQTLYIVQEFIEGHDLTREILPGKQLSESYVIKLLQDVLEVLSFVHQQNVIHRDIKPQNLMRRQRDGRIFLIDFGAVKQLGSIQVNSEGDVVSSVVIGTWGYLPYEQSKGKPCLGSDIYALGMTLIHALTGISPDQLDEDPQTGEVIWLDRTQISQPLAEILTKMIRRHPSRRYPAASEALTDLTHKIISPPSPPSPLPPSFSSSSPSPSSSPLLLNRSRRKIIQTIGWLGAGISAAAFLGQRAWRSDSPSPVAEETPASGSPAPVEVTPSVESLSLQPFQFETVTVNESGQITDRRSGEAKFFAEDLGNGVTLEMVEIPGGKFRMGSPEGEEGRGNNESPQHEVTVPSFFMGKFVVTQAQYQAIVGSNPSDFKAMKRPVENVSWNDAVAFCEKLSQRTGRTYRLPSEAEWEYACRAGTTTPFHFGETITTDLANYDSDGVYASASEGEYRGQTTDIGSFSPNAFGLYDMHGNVYEWCQDVWHENYDGAPIDGSARTTGGDDSFRLLRGGSWSEYPENCRSANRDWYIPDDKDNENGFRVVCSLTRTL